MNRPPPPMPSRSKPTGGVDWPRRVLTVSVAIPGALALLSSDAGTFLLATGLCALSLVEYATNLTPPILAAIARHDEDSTASAKKCNDDVPPPSTRRWGSSHVLMLTGLGVGICGTAWLAQQNKLLHDAAMIAAVIATVFVHVATAGASLPRLLVAILLDVLALGFVVGGFSHAILLRYVSPAGRGLQILGLACAWVGDSAALLCGSAWGQTPLAPRVSPRKTAVGALASVLGSALTVMALAPLLGIHMDSISEQFVLGLVLGALAVLGDLLESLLKRVAGCKDSGTLFPGHGGCLDRMDSFFFIAHALYYYAAWRLPSP